MNRVLHSLKEGKVLDHFVVVGDGSRLSAVDDGVPLTPQYILALALFHTGEGNRDAFRQVYELTSSRLFGICFRVCGDYAIAQDVLHDVYLTVWKRAGAFDTSRGSAIAWMSAIARNRAIDWRRAQPPYRFKRIEEAWEIADPLPLVSEVLLTKEATTGLLACLATLEQHHREAIVGAFFGGLTHADMALRRGVPVGTMKSWVRRGLVKLRQAIEDAECSQ